jgi:2-polyprenyl-3-methyl-5-hydroxy-6-metoxy-1,4-benzoquinol methylase
MNFSMPASLDLIDTRTPFDSLDRSALRDYYEAQGEAVRGAEGEINCSEPPIVDIVMRMVMEHASEFKNLLDVGCGANLVYDQAISELGKQVVGVDFTWNFLKLAPQDAPAPVSLVQGDALSLPFQDGAFDAVICSETAEHIPDDDSVVRELARILRPCGWLFFTVPNLWNAARILGTIKNLNPRVSLMPGHLREYSLKKVARLLGRQFEIQKVYPVGFGWTGNSVGGFVERSIRRGFLSQFSKSIAVAARKL